MKEKLTNALLEIYDDSKAPLVFYFTDDEAEYVAEELLGKNIIFDIDELEKKLMEECWKFNRQNTDYLIGYIMGLRFARNIICDMRKEQD